MVEKSDIASNPADWWSTFYRPVRQFGQQVAEFFSPSSDAAVSDDCYEINLELPGVSDDDISIEAHDNRLVVTGEKKSSHEESGKNYYFSERSYGSFRRSFRLPSDADEDRIDATHKDGVLTIRVPKTQPSKPSPKKIAINQG
ncbi:MAG: Hsp20/alpha crystallin family protein [Alphaproteobacteria bacterium]